MLFLFVGITVKLPAVPPHEIIEEAGSFGTSRNDSVLSATLRIGESSLDIYAGCDMDQLKRLVAILKSC